METRPQWSAALGPVNTAADSEECSRMQLARPCTMVTLLAAVMTSEGAEPGSCVTVSQRRCSFPFTFNNTEYSACTGAGHPIGRPWCYTAEVVFSMPY